MGLDVFAGGLLITVGIVSLYLIVTKPSSFWDSTATKRTRRIFNDAIVNGLYTIAGVGAIVLGIIEIVVAR